MSNVQLTVFLRHEQSKGFDANSAQLRRLGWWEHFPPDGVEIVSWMVVANVGQIVTLSLPPHRLPTVVSALERRAWGAFTTECHVSYDFLPIRKNIIEAAARTDQPMPNLFRG